MSLDNVVFTEGERQIMEVNLPVGSPTTYPDGIVTSSDLSTNELIISYIPSSESDSFAY